ncbi:pyrimidine dimer DNA glycosylase/endonuclease V [Brachybacterium sp. UNK5269]|uniref:pyrimidine dimer DNA glycosylase/endonuclease V n=1 Tax=Brachybacterium sp. UNK5269 TaxID=3408576 RepID=UPI003BAE37CE
MRLWSVHPRHLDRQGLTGCWREALLAQAVLAGRTKGYRSHPQLERFRAQQDPLAAVGAYLEALADEATARGYRFDRSRIERPPSAPGAGPVPLIPVTEGQLDLEREHLRAKLALRSPHWRAAGGEAAAAESHPLFRVVPGPVESWERAAG